MAWDDVDSQQRDIFDQLPASDYFDSEFDRDYAQQLYEIGFTHSADDYDAAGIDMDAVYAAREEFFEFMQMEDADFPWDEWREAMGYE